MSDVVSLLDGFDQAGIEASLVTTFNAYLPFYEDVVLRRLLAAGCRHNTVLMDARQLAACLGEVPLRPSAAGYDYTLAPVRSKGAFHPKLMLLVGPKRSVTYVGSHNLTLSGYGLNRELTCKTSWASGADDASADIARAAWRATKSWLRYCGQSLPRQTVQSVLAIEDIAPWLRQKENDRDGCRILFQSEGSRPLFEQLRALLPTSVQNITVLGAFFDARCEFLYRLNSIYPDAKLRIAVEPSTVQLDHRGTGRVRGTWIDASSLNGRSGYLHAKALYFEGSGGVNILAFGSANPSAPAWAIAGDRNEELICVWAGAQATAYASELGLDEVKDLPLIDQEALRRIPARSPTRASSLPISAITNEVAIITQGAIEVSIDACRAAPTCLSLLDENGLLICEVVPKKLLDGAIRSDIEPPLVDRVRFASLQFADGAEAYLICHHVERRENAARTGRQTQLRNALLNLQSDPQSLTALLAAVQKVVFGAEVSSVQPTSNLRKGAGRHQDREEEVKSLEGAAGAERRTSMSRVRPRLAGGDLGDFLQLLIYEVGKTLSVADGSSGGSSRSEEEQIDADDERPVEPHNMFENDTKIVEACGKKVGTLVGRMVRVLHLPASAPEQSLIVVAQLTAVLCTLRALRQLDRTERWRQTGQSLVPENFRDKLLDGILDAVVGGPHPLLRRPEVAAADHSMEVIHLRGLMVWLAWECKFRADRKFAFADEIDDREFNVLQRAALLELIVPAVQYDDARGEAERSIQATASLRRKASAGQWLQTHLAWGRRVASNAASPPAWPVGRESVLTIGSIVALPEGLGRSLRVVAGHSNGNVVVVDFCAENFERAFRAEKVIKISNP